MTIKPFIIAGLTGLVFFSGCKKDDDTLNGNNNNSNNNNNNTTKTKTELLTSGKWQVTVDKEDWSDGAGIYGSDIYYSYKECQKDNFITFTTAGKMIEDEGANVCNGSSQTDDNTSWELITNDTQVKLTKGTEVMTVDIAELTSTTLTVKYAFDDGPDHKTKTMSYKNLN